MILALLLFTAPPSFAAPSPSPPGPAPTERVSEFVALEKEVRQKQWDFEDRQIGEERAFEDDKRGSERAIALELENTLGQSTDLAAARKLVQKKRDAFTAEWSKKSMEHQKRMADERRAFHTELDKIRRGIR